MAIFRRSDPHQLTVSMTGVKMGDRFAQVGCPNAGRLAAVAAKVGLSGRAVAVVPDEAASARARKAAAREGVLLEIEIAPPTRLPCEDAAFDFIVLDDTAGMLGGMEADDRVATVREAMRLLRPGGRVMVLGAAPRSGLGGLLTRAPAMPPLDPTIALQAGGCRTVRVLAEREGLVFVEGMKPGA
jgi:ubiquinone/menaquinone biosynthesis C-methylase UbiE